MELDVSSMVSPFVLFPGQIVAVHGINPTGQRMAVQKVMEGAGVAEYDKKKALDRPIKIVTAAGPFTTSDNLDYAPLYDLLKTVVQPQQPDVLLLMGPFVGISHDDTVLQYEEDGPGTHVPFERVFCEGVARVLQDELCDENHEWSCQVVLVPSVEDGGICSNVFPQAPLQDRLQSSSTAMAGKLTNVPGGDGLALGTLGLPNGIHCVSNPCTLVLHHSVVVGVTSTDYLFDLNSDVTAGHLATGTRMVRLAEQVVTQGLYYPLQPAGKSVQNIDWSHHLKYSELPCRPDILMSPSKLACFAKTSNKSLLVNPGNLTKGGGSTGGTYGVVHVYPGDDKEKSTTERTVVEIKKI